MGDKEMNKKRVIIILLIIGLLLMTPISAKVITSEVTDKKIVKTYGACFTVHTADFGDIRVDHEVYNQIMIGDNITFNDNCEDFEFYYTVYRVNGVLIYNGVN